MMGIDMVLTPEANPGLDDLSLSIVPRIFLAGENRTMAAGEVELPAFIDDVYDGSYGRMAMTFLTSKIRTTVPYTLSFEFLSGTVDVLVSEDTHYFHDGSLAHEVFAVRGTIPGKEPNKVDLKAPHVVLCFVEQECIETLDE